MVLQSYLKSFQCSVIRQGLLYTGHELDIWPIQLVGNVVKGTIIDYTLKMSLKISKTIFIKKVRENKWSSM